MGLSLHYRANDRTTFDFEAKDVLTAFDFMAYCDSIFGITHCGNCSCPDLSLVHRTPQGYDFYSVKCNKCKFELKFGQQKENKRLYPKGWEEPYQGGSAKDESGDDGVDQTPKEDRKKPAPADDIAF